MGLLSILPPSLTIVETWLIRLFLLLGLLTIGPWVAFLVYDMLLYILRTFLYEIPVVGGRAQGRRKPPKPTVERRPDGRKRAFSFMGSTGDEGTEQGGDEIMKRRRRRTEMEGGREGADDAVGD